MRIGQGRGVATARGGWSKKDAEIEAALAHARERRMCLAAQTKLGVELLERRVASHLLIRVFPHLYEEPSYWKTLSVTEKSIRVIRTAATLHPDWVFCQTSAAIAHGLEVSQPDPGVVHIVTTPEAHTASNRHVRRHAVGSYTVCVASGVHVVDMDTCVTGCIGLLDLPHGLAVADSYLREKRLATSDLVRLAESIGYRPRRRNALRTAGFADPLAENGGESVARGTMIELGYEIPRLQVEIANPLDPDDCYRVDFLWPGDSERPAIIGELDGMGKYQEPEMLQGRSTLDVLTEERLRESRLTLTDARIMRFHFGDVLDRSGFARLLDASGVPKAADGLT